MALTRTYPITSVVSGQGISVFGADNLVTPLATADDGIFWRDNLEQAGGLTGISLRISYDQALPLNSIIPTITLSSRMAQNYTDLQYNMGLLITMGAEFGGDSFTQPPNLVTGVVPEDGDWAEFSTAIGPTLGSSWTTTFINTMDISLVPSWQLVGSKTPYFFFLDFFDVTFNLTLPTPGVLSDDAAAQDVARNNFLATGTFTLGVDDVTSSYPVTTYFEWTEVDPDTINPNDKGQFDIFRTAETTWTAGSGSPITLHAQVPANFNPYDPSKSLTPNKTYWFRSVAANVDGEIINSEWASTTTLLFDVPVSL